MKSYSSTYREGLGGRGIVLFLLFLLSLFNFYTLGITGFAFVCLIPAGLILLALALKHQEIMFWTFFAINYFVIWLHPDSHYTGHTGATIPAITILHYHSPADESLDGHTYAPGNHHLDALSVYPAIQ